MWVQFVPMYVALVLVALAAAILAGVWSWRLVFAEQAILPELLPAPPPPDLPLVPE